jgi:PAS domain S-box-containing protein
MESGIFSESKLAAAILDTLDAVVCVMDVDGKIVYFNHACQSMTGYTEAVVILFKPIFAQGTKDHEHTDTLRFNGRANDKDR